MGSSLKVIVLVTCALILQLYNTPSAAVLADEVSGGQVPPPSQPGKFHLRILERASAFKNRQLRSDLLEEVRKVMPVNTRPRVLEVVDFQLQDDGDVFDGNSKRFDDYGHSRFGKRNEFDDYGHSRFGRK